MICRTALTLFALAALPASGLAQPAAPLPALNLEQETAVRCGAAFAIVASEQARGTPVAAKWPALGTRGREFFVRTGARLMDDTGATRPQVQALFARAASSLRADPGALPARLDSLRVPCVSLLDLAIPAR
ncbi:hypothetical protein ACFFF7_13515 [Novosphingobium aquiterrae]|uniref:Uncharacterized protein n=1 Tax=Novosphingobium aquiterrae TaxID=624388 RepID=A0ABV6PKQ9_9SPHN